MKTIYALVVGATCFLLASSANAQSWGFTLPGGGGFAYSRGNGGAVAVNGGGWGGGAVSAVGPVVYYPANSGCYGGPVYYPQGPGYGGSGVVPQSRFVRTGPQSNYTSYWVRYPNIW